MSKPPDEMRVLPSEEAWTPAELAAVRDELGTDINRLRAELTAFEGDRAGWGQESLDQGGNDDVDVRAASFERDQAKAVIANARDLLHQCEQAVQRIKQGTFGTCAACGNPIGKDRMTAFPQATLCIECKRRQEHH